MNSMDPKNQREEFVKRLTKWYKMSGRRFSWRERNLTPYEVLVLEILLQRTMAQRVDRLFPEFSRKYPNARVLDSTPKKQLVSDIETLGLEERRAKILKDLARVLVREWNGEVPESVDDLAQLPGVGPYVANAISCFSRQRAVPLVDTNVGRVLHRVFALPVSRNPSSDRHLWTFVKDLVPRMKAKEFNWALIDLGAMVCRPRNPLCDTCPMSSLCIYRGTTNQF
ncbi:MAG: hypothetical protein OEZ48_16835 [Candidatus Bathyarchaeota archaeon]|nr:hypothetical protein [Candidatus Bathyarchaeota archaeon]MDH5689516.1 hypothetical protein [Candidatus Bathyarchaeota archaeon]